MQKNRLKIGDIIEIPLPNGKKGFIQYIYPDKWGDLVGIYDHIINLNDTLNIDELKNKKFKFYPVLTRINQGKKLSQSFQQFEKLRRLGYASEIFAKMASDFSQDYNWKIIDNIKVVNFTYPNFIWKEGATLAKNKTTKWYLYNGRDNIELGKKLPTVYKHLEYQSSLPPDDIVRLIMENTTKNREEERKMIKKGN